VPEPLLLLPGLMCDARLFAPQVEALAGLAPVAVGDLTGAPTVQGLAASVLAAAPDRFALAGLSMGGIVAMEVVRQAPGRVARLALLDTNHRAETPERQALRGPQIARALAGELRAVLVEEMKPLYLAPENRDRGAVLDTILDMALALGPEVFARQSAALRDRPDQAATLRRVGVPTLVLCGRHDALCPPERHAEMASLVPGARLTVVEGAGHLPTLERPEATTAALRAWLLAPGDARGWKSTGSVW
jgi:pimeloyl-ACP methyl ester carboxylesterase